MSQTQKLAKQLKNATPEERENALKELGKLLGQEVVTKTEVTSVVSDENAKRIIIPSTMDKMEASEELERQYHDEENIVNVDINIEGYDYKDTLAAIRRGTEEHFGWVDGQATYSFFGKTLPKFINITTNIKDGIETTEECFYGRINVAQWDNAKMDVGIRNAGSVNISFEAKKKHKERIHEYFAVIKKELKERSIYIGKSVSIEKSTYGGVEYEIFENKANPRIFLNEGNALVIKDFIMPQITKSGKRCYLLTGDYGTGKTETAMKIGEYANQHKMSFLYLKDAAMLEEAILLCRNYDPCVLFLEDVDEVAAGKERGTDINRILNTLDGVQSKNGNTKVIFTTNHEDKINKAFRRPGRIDQIVKFEYPDMDTKFKIAESYLKDLPDYSEAVTREGIKLFADAQGAVIAETCKRVLMLAQQYESFELSHFKSSSESMKPQIDLMSKEAVTESGSVQSELMKLVEGVIAKSVAPTLEVINNKVS